MRYIVIPTIMASTQEEFISQLERYAGVSRIQIDVMDHKFVPNKTILTIPNLRKFTQRTYFEAHLMVYHPWKYISSFSKKGIDLFIIHYESFLEQKNNQKSLRTRELAKTLDKIRENKKDYGLALNPETPLEKIQPLLEHAHQLTIMGVNPGFSGQRFQKSVLNKIRTAREEYKRLDIEVDGGINSKTLRFCKKAGANLFASHSELEKHSNPKKFVREWIKKVN